jgi:hypothetical protein
LLQDRLAENITKLNAAAATPEEGGKKGENAETPDKDSEKKERKRIPDSQLKARDRVYYIYVIYIVLCLFM